MAQTKLAFSAEVHVLFNGYTESGVASTVSFVRDGEQRIIIDPGMVPEQQDILKPLLALGETAASITDVIFSHHHPDHTLNAALFPNAHFHDCWAIYHHDVWQSRPAEGFFVSPSIQLIETPGHTPQDITTLVGTKDGVYAFTHLWWAADGPDEDPLATDLEHLHTNRQRVLQLARVIVPGHGAPFVPDENTSR
jgi:glyoxylase-like metal-dependent hydrolase (beta-lactamase superfamily II)